MTMNGQRALAGVLVATILVVAACSSSAATTPTAATTPSSATSSGDPTGAMTQTSDGGQVTAVVGWAGPVGGAVFDVTLDTHSVDLDALDLSDAILRNDRSETLTA